MQKNEEKIEIDILANSEWRGKVNLERALNKETAYYVFKFFGSNKTFRISAADAGGMIYKHLYEGVYHLKDNGELVLHQKGGGGFSFRYREKGGRPEHIFAGYFGVNLYRQ